MLKDRWQDATLFVYFSYLMTYTHSFNRIHAIHLSGAIRRGLSPSLHLFIASVGKPEPSRESNLGLPYSKPTRYQLSHAVHKNVGEREKLQPVLWNVDPDPGGQK
jgi:hypothetical protein